MKWKEEPGLGFQDATKDNILYFYLGLKFHSFWLGSKFHSFW